LAALADIEKSDDSFGVVHDGTHGVKANLRIRPMDQCHFPGIADKQFIIRRAQDEKISLLGIKADVSKAHRRLVLGRLDIGLQACQLLRKSVWLNLVDTFGSGIASCWWTKIASCIARLGMLLEGRDEFWQPLYADDSD
jgi:hypothetical protein